MRKLSHKLKMAIIATVASAVAAATAIGVMLKIFRPPPDAGLLEVLPGKPLHHARRHIPIIVVHSPDAYAWAASIEEACKWWNARSKLTLFVYQGESPSEEFTQSLFAGAPGMTVVTAREGGDARDAHTHLQFNRKGEIIAAPIRLDLDTPAGLRARVIAHELGHVLGFAHDPEITNSVMHPTALPGVFNLTGADLVRLIEWYG